MADHQPSRNGTVATAGRTGAAVRFEALDSWRGICALLVAMMHFPASGPIGESPLVRNSYLFVDYFFVLSGFVIAHGYGHRLRSGVDHLRFTVLRVGRVYPLHVAVLAAFVLFEGLRWSVPALRGDGAAPFTDGNSLPELLSSLVLLNGIGLEERLTWNGPSWSISAEVWTYLLFGAVVVVLGRRHWLALVASTVAGPVVLYLYSPHFMDATYDYGLVRCLYGFSLGALVYHFAAPRLVAARRRSVAPGGWTALELAAVLAVLAFVSSAGKGPYGLAAPPVFAAALLIFAREAGLVSRLLRTRALLWLGTLSYGIYMVHIFVQARMINAASLVEKATGVRLVGEFAVGAETFHGFGILGGAFGTAMMAVMVAAVVAVAWIGYVVVEKPCQRLSRRLAERIGRSAPVRAAPARLWTIERIASR